MYQVQNYVDDKVASIEVTPPAPPVEVPSDFEAQVWEAIAELKATNQCQSSGQNPPPVEPMPDPCIALLTNQVATLQGEIEYLRQNVINIPDTYSWGINKLLPAANVKAPAATKQMSTATLQTPAAIKQPSTATAWPPTATT
ncbi:hypothetical protein DSO57_1016300 [Entomophthora muscae]|uniref:Uncharacterized protein n=1 Tax=Entomophthora muscae TaxID=34485 RepID=A0ACC2U3Z5_9FUNG|nr:hypothetical protein DSO57_1016300 [Entomophthora muscae]